MPAVAPTRRDLEILDVRLDGNPARNTTEAESGSVPRLRYGAAGR